MPIEFHAQDISDTQKLGQRLAQALFPGAVVALIGPMGAGKTHLVKAIAEGLGIRNSAAVNSPTFVLIQEYDARLPIYHFDAHRLATAAEFADLGVHEYFHGDGVCLVEWADKFPALLPADHLEIRIEATGPTRRKFALSACGPRHAVLLQPFGAD
jgi:tRNA threonylcarbamoyladenosine biosynthesis protein TsaE